MKKIVFGLMAVSLLAVTGCKKDKDENCDLNSTTLQGSYKITAVSYKADAATPAVDDFATWDACEKDDIYTLGASFAASVSEGSNVCSPSNADTGNWLFNDTNSQLTLAFPSYNIVGTISNFTCSGFTITTPGTDPGEVTIVTMAKQ